MEGKIILSSMQVWRRYRIIEEGYFQFHSLKRIVLEKDIHLGQRKILNINKAYWARKGSLCTL